MSVCMHGRERNSNRIRFAQWFATLFEPFRLRRDFLHTAAMFTASTTAQLVPYRETGEARTTRLVSGELCCRSCAFYIQ
jgi:hypothetical protein